MVPSVSFAYQQSSPTTRIRWHTDWNRTRLGEEHHLHSSVSSSRRAFILMLLEDPIRHAPRYRLPSPSRSRHPFEIKEGVRRSLLTRVACRYGSAFPAGGIRFSGTVAFSNLRGQSSRGLAAIVTRLAVCGANNPASPPVSRFLAMTYFVPMISSVKVRYSLHFHLSRLCEYTVLRRRLLCIIVQSLSKRCF